MSGNLLCQLLKALASGPLRFIAHDRCTICGGKAKDMQLGAAFDLQVVHIVHHVLQQSFDAL